MNRVGLGDARPIGGVPLRGCGAIIFAKAVATALDFVRACPNRCHVPPHPVTRPSPRSRLDELHLGGDVLLDLRSGDRPPDAAWMRCHDAVRRSLLVSGVDLCRALALCSSRQPNLGVTRPPASTAGFGSGSPRRISGRLAGSAAGSSPGCRPRHRSPPGAHAPPLTSASGRRRSRAWRPSSRLVGALEGDAGGELPNLGARLRLAIDLREDGGHTFRGLQDLHDGFSCACAPAAGPPPAFRLDRWTERQRSEPVPHATQDTTSDAPAPLIKSGSRPAHALHPRRAQTLRRVRASSISSKDFDLPGLRACPSWGPAWRGLREKPNRFSGGCFPSGVVVQHARADRRYIGTPSKIDRSRRARVPIEQVQQPFSPTTCVSPSTQITASRADPRARRPGSARTADWREWRMRGTPRCWLSQHALDVAAGHLRERRGEGVDPLVLRHVDAARQDLTDGFPRRFRPPGPARRRSPRGSSVVTGVDEEVEAVEIIDGPRSRRGMRGFATPPPMVAAQPANHHNSSETFQMRNVGNRSRFRGGRMLGP